MTTAQTTTNTPNAGVLMLGGQSHYVTRPELAELPTPLPKEGSTYHQPIPHHRLVSALTDGIIARGWTIRNEQLGLCRASKQLFGVLQLESPGAGPGEMNHLALDKQCDMRPAFGFRSSHDQSLAVRGVAGARVTVCDNLMLAGDHFMMNRKSTKGLNLEEMIESGLDRFIEQYGGFRDDVNDMTVWDLVESDAKKYLCDLFRTPWMPSRLFKPVCQNYFQKSDDRPDCIPDTLLGLNNAVTRALQKLPPAAHFRASGQVGLYFQDIVRHNRKAHGWTREHG